MIKLSAAEWKVMKLLWEKAPWTSQRRNGLCKWYEMSSINWL